MSGRETPSEILARSPEEGARRLALSYLDQAASALSRLAESSPEASDPEALHDLRVAARRLRTCLRTYREQFAGGLPKKLRRRLRRLARATGPGRDAEVQIAWLEGRARARELGRHQRSGLSWLLARLERRLDDAYRKLRAELAGGFPALEQGLRRALTVYRAEVHLDSPHPATFAATAADRLALETAALEHDLGRVGSADDEEQAHRARISAKRLRYLLDPLVEELPAATPIVKRLKALQDLLGELHDAHVMEEELGRALEEAAAARARRLLELVVARDYEPARLRSERRKAPEGGLLALARINRARRDRLFEELEAEWLGERAADFWDAARGLEETLRAAGAATPE